VIDKPELQWMALAPELTTAIGAMVALLVGMGRGRASRVASIVVALVALAVSGGLAIANFSHAYYAAFGGQLRSDELTNVARIIAAACGIVAVVLAVRGRADDRRHGEFHALVLACVCGMGLFVGSASFVTLFVGLELFSISLYVLCALDAERSASLESGLKYLIVGGMSSAVLLYGSALVFGATGHLELGAIGSFDGDRGVLLQAGMAMVIGGLAFKMSAAPVHWWTPDVYEGAGTPVTAFMSTATKAVAFLAMARVLVTAFPQEADTWMPVVAGLGALSIAWGNVAALVQGHLKRMLAYSSIAQAGYLTCGIVGWETSGIAALVYALVVYAAMTLGAFAYVVVLERDLGREATWADLAGRGWIGEDRSLVHALPALGMAVCMLSLAGIPPTAGFFGKLGLFQAAVDAGYGWLAVVGALGSVVSLAYYLRALVELYMRSPDAARASEEAASLPAPTTGPTRPAGTRMPAVAALGVVLAAVVLLLAFLPNRVFDAGCDARDALLATGECVTTVDAAAANDAG
jgi:NADH-quinone oxidoreductase subunit N